MKFAAFIVAALATTSAMKVDSESVNVAEPEDELDADNELVERTFTSHNAVSLFWTHFGDERQWSATKAFEEAKNMFRLIGRVAEERAEEDGRPRRSSYGAYGGYGRSSYGRSYGGYNRRPYGGSYVQVDSSEDSKVMRNVGLL